MKHRIGMVTMLVASIGASASTVALWPLEYDPLNPVNGGHCAVSAANDLECAGIAGGGDVTAAYGVGWNLPANPDVTAGLRFSPVNKSYVRTDGTVRYSWRNPQAGLLVAPDKNWTVECFARLDQNPSYLRVLMSAFWHVDGSDADRWMVMFKPNSATGGCNLECYCGNPDIRTNNTDYVFAEFSAAELTSLKNGFHHLALSHRVDVDAGVTEWKFYFDGVLRNTRTINQLPISSNRAKLDNSFELAGRGAASGSMFEGSLDYCRISDEILEPAAFLNAGGGGSLVSSTDPTLVRWPLGRTAAGTIDGAPSAGTNYLGGARLAPSSGNTARSKLLVADDDRAFVGQIPNAATTLKAADNTGCIAFPKGEVASALAIPNLGSKLTLTNDFTVEGWYKFENRHLKRWTTWLRLCGSIGSAGWALQLYYNPDTDSHPCYFALHAQESGAVRIHGSYSPNLGDVAMGTEDEWRHIALVYDCDGGEGGRGIWRFYVNGVLSGSCTNTKTVTPDLAYPTEFVLNNAPSSAGSNQSTAGKFDHWRVCGAALAPEQFLCATTGARDATAVLAYWPLDAKRGVYIDGSDLTGNYPFEPLTDDLRCAAAVDDTPPQADRPSDAGCVGFVNHGGNNSYLATFEPEVLELFNKPNWTFESWMKRTNNNSTWQIVFAAGSSSSVSATSWPGAIFFFTYRPDQDKGFVIWSNWTVENTSDVSFKDTSGNSVLLPMNEWVHVALSFENAAGTATYRLYTNGVAVSTLSGKFLEYKTVASFFLGGRPSTANSLRGCMADVRLSAATLTPGEFLCDRVATAKSTYGFWPLDCADSVPDLGNRVDVFSDFGGKNVQGLAYGARGVVPNPDTSAGFVGNPKGNAGAVSIAAGGNVGSCLAPYLGASFTAEGWVKWANAAGAAKEVVAECWDQATLGGWRLILDTTTSPAKVRLQARCGKYFTRVADGAFAVDPAALRGEWRHLKLSYDPELRTGVWALAVDGVECGAVTNFFRPTRGFAVDGQLRLGAAANETDVTSFIGGLDMWRLSSGVLTAEDLLYRAPKGLTFNFR